MTLPKNLTKEHLLAAIEKIDEEGIPPDAASKFYDVQYNGKLYPPKLIVSYANLFANNKELDRNKFAGGRNTACFKLLEEHGFKIVPKHDIFPLLQAFLLRVHNNPTNLKKLDSLEDYLGFDVEVGFGKGNVATIPWIAFLGPGQIVSNGIYPVYLYYKEFQELVFAFGVSETHVPEKVWHVKAQTVEDYCTKVFKQKPKRYGSSFYYSSYKINPATKDFGLNRKQLNEDLSKVLDIYTSTLSQQNVEQKPSSVKSKLNAAPFKYAEFVSNLESAGFLFPEFTIRRFVSSLAAKPFVILTGLSGSGKTKLALSFSKWIAEDNDQVCIVPVGADWTNREPLLGFPNMQQKDTYIHPENGALTIILSAIQNPDKPFFLILDEMNLSHVERYFADFLSCMESGERIKLHPGKDNWNNGDIPGSFTLPSNLFIIGTVNIDETTYMFSPKVLDRSSVIEFRVDSSEMKQFLNRQKISNLQLLAGKGSAMAKSFLTLTSKENIQPNLSEDDRTEILKLFEILKEVGAEFGYRTIYEVQIYEQVARKISDWSTREIMDAIIMQKFLPRLHGSRRKLENPLKKIIEHCLEKHEDINDYLKLPISSPDPKKVKYKISLEKVQRMYQSLISNSFTSYAEA
jgi:5-methylcytosine-specific restriction enzyme B